MDHMQRQRRDALVERSKKAALLRARGATEQFVAEAYAVADGVIGLLHELATEGCEPLEQARLWKLLGDAYASLATSPRDAALEKAIAALVEAELLFAHADSAEESIRADLALAAALSRAGRAADAARRVRTALKRAAADTSDLPADLCNELADAAQRHLLHAG
jgi:hypothetical protein